jgi:hypothetical protein
MQLKDWVCLAPYSTGGVPCRSEMASALQAAHACHNGLRMPDLVSRCPHIHINKLQMLQSKCLGIATNAPWYVGNKQIHEDLGI